jgi:hypothetical protein
MSHQSVVRGVNFENIQNFPRDLGQDIGGTA